MYWRADSRDLECYKVDVTSPEQFVPLFVALFELKQIDSGAFVYRSDIGMHVPKWKVDSYVSSDEAKRYLKHLLKQPCPKAFGMPYIFEGATGIRNDSDCFSAFSTPPYTGFSLRFNAYEQLNLPFCICNVKGTRLPAQSSLDFKSVEYGSVPYSQNYSKLLEIDCVVVVQAKYIPAVRASFYLQEPLQLPFGALRILRRGYMLRPNILNFLNKFAAAQGCEIEFLSPAEIKSYVIGPEPQIGLTEILDKAILLSEGVAEPVTTDFI